VAGASAQRPGSSGLPPVGSATSNAAFTHAVSLGDTRRLSWRAVMLPVLIIQLQWGAMLDAVGTWHTPDTLQLTSRRYGGSSDFGQAPVIGTAGTGTLRYETLGNPVVISGGTPMRKIMWSGSKNPARWAPATLNWLVIVPRSPRVPVLFASWSPAESVTILTGNVTHLQRDRGCRRSEGSDSESPARVDGRGPSGAPELLV